MVKRLYEPQEAQPVMTLYCGECGRGVDIFAGTDPDEYDLYEDEMYETICRDCLLMRHKKVFDIG